MSDSTTNQKVLKALRDARIKLEQAQQHEPIAIIGMAGRFPGAEDISSFWEMLVGEQSGVRFLSESELAESGIDKTTIQQKNYVPAWSSFENPETFDARFFSYSPREATLLDPQHRVFLECAWHALEDAGYDSSRYSDPIGVFAGSALNRYLINLFNRSDLRETTDNVQAVVSNVMGLMPTRVSYHLNLKGPSVGIQTGCSTSLVAVHEAYRSLLANDCAMALAGGVTVNEIQPQGYVYQEGSIASPNGLTCSFDEKGKGTVFGNGVGIVVMKKLSRAQADGDRVLAVILGSAINNDGSDKVGLIAPSVSGQANVIAAAIKEADIDPETISYVEAHGTGTEMGDPIEFSALNQVFHRTSSNNKHTCKIGSVKSNVGHLDAAAGITGLIKTVLSLQNNTLPATLNYHNPNSKIDLQNSCFAIQNKTENWSPQSTNNEETPLRAGVSSFGMGGTNAHVVLEQAGTQTVNPSPLPARPWQLMPISAKTDSALNKLKTSVMNQVQQGQLDELPAMSFTLQQGRKQLDKRVALLTNAQGRCESINLNPSISSTEPKNIVFLFSGQGSQHAGMCADIYQTEPQFKKYLDQCAELLQTIEPEFNLQEIIFSDSQTKSARKKLQQTAIAQPAIFSVEYSLAKCLEEWGIIPDSMIGHSIGEYVAACLAGVFDLEQAIKLVYQRGQLMQSCETGSMLAVMMTEKETKDWLTTKNYHNSCDIAAINAEMQTVISGTTKLIAEILARIEEEGIAARLVPTSHAFHSHMMEPILDDFHNTLNQFDYSEPQIDVYSNVTGNVLTPEQATDANYWVKQLRHTVKFHQGITNLLSQSESQAIFVEIGTGKTLCNLLPNSKLCIETLAGKNNAENDSEILTRALAKLWQAGIEIDWLHYNKDRPQQRTAMPLYPFEREPYWVDLQQIEQVSPQNSIDSHDQQAYLYSSFWTTREVATNSLMSETLLVGFESKQIKSILSKYTSSNNLNTLSEINDNTIANINIDSLDQLVLFVSPNDEGDVSQQVSSVINSALRQIQKLLLALTTDSLSSPLSLIIITQGAFSLSLSEGISPAQRALQSMFQVIGQESEQLTVRCIDLEAKISIEEQLPIMLDTLDGLANASNKHTHPKCYLLRNGNIYQRQFRIQSLAQGHTNTPIKAGGHYLIAGDLSNGLGMVFAQSLFDRHQAKITFYASSDLPTEDQWSHWLASHGPKHPVSMLVKNMMSLKQEGLNYQWLNKDTYDLTLGSDWSQLLTNPDMEPIDGIFIVEAMGDQSVCDIRSAGSAEIDEILSDRIKLPAGLEACLSELTHKDMKLPEFVAVQSSLSAIIGGIGFSIYAAVSAALDAFITSKSKVGVSTRWLSLNWDAVDNDVMSAKKGQVKATGSNLMDSAFTVEQAWASMLNALNVKHASQLLVSSANFQQRLELSLSSIESNSTESFALSDQRPDLDTPYVEPSTDTERFVVDAMGDLLGINKIGIHDDFFDLGGQSLLAIQAVTRLRQEYDVELPMRALLFDARTPAAIAKLIDEERSKQKTPMTNQSDDQTSLKQQENNTHLNLSEDQEKEFESLLSAVEQLSPEEAKEQLN